MLVERYSLLAGAVAGRKTPVRRGDGLPYTDGHVIYVPEGDDQAVRVGVVIQASLLAAGSLDSRIVARLAGRQTQVRRYLTLEAARAVDGLAACVPGGVAALVSGCWGGPVSTSPHESFDWVARGRPIPEAPDQFGTIRPRKLLRRAALAGAAAPTRQDQEGTAKQLPMPELEDDEESEKIRLFSLFSSPIGFQHPLFRWMKDLVGMGRTPTAEGDGAVELPVGGVNVAEVGRSGRPMPTPAGLAFELSNQPGGEARYPEWDWERQSYRVNWCSVGEYDPAPADRDRDLDPGMDILLHRELARLGLAYERHIRQPEGDTLDLDALVELGVDRATGEPGDERVYQARRRTAHDLGVVVVLDASGSTGESDPGGTAVFDGQRRLVANLVMTLEELGDRVAAYGFRSHGRDDVRFLRIKEFDDRFDHAARRRLAALEPSGFTRLGTAVRHASNLVAGRAGTSNLLVVVVSDGLPYDHGYEATYAERDTRRALQEAVARGVGCVCVSVRSSTDEEALERLWGNVSHRRLPHPGELGRHVRPLFRVALQAAAWEANTA
ncbi:MAG: nitric oxide reductase activation protein NorD [Acidimicrobiia bacterium]